MALIEPVGFQIGLCGVPYAPAIQGVESAEKLPFRIKRFCVCLFVVSGIHT